MLRGIDISNWQAGLVPHELDIDFCICKATEGTGFVDRYCDGFVQDCISHNILWGFYHFATSGGDPCAEADFFVENTRNYFHHGIPVLDYEVSNPHDCAWCESFIVRVHELTGVWCMLYTSASWVHIFEDSAWIPQTCGLWLAGYPYPATDWTTDEMPYGIYPWEFCAIWQFTSSLQIAPSFGGIDGDLAYMDAAAWMKYANSDGSVAPDPAPVQPTLSINELCKQIMRGEWGNGDTRMQALVNAGYDATYVQEYLDDMFVIADEVIRGEWGNGDYRKHLLGYYGLDYDLIQMIVNAILEAN